MFRTKFSSSSSSSSAGVVGAILLQQQQRRQSSTSTATPTPPTTSSTFKPGTNPGNVSAPSSVEYHPTEIESAYQLLRLLLRSSDVKVRSRQGKQFMKRRILAQWRIGREETEPMKQRAWMERAAAVLHAMHIKGRNPRPDEPIELDFTTGPGARRSRSQLEEEEGAAPSKSVEVDGSKTKSAATATATSAEGKSEEKK